MLTVFSAIRIYTEYKLPPTSAYTANASCKNSKKIIKSRCPILRGRPRLFT